MLSLKTRSFAVAFAIFASSFCISGAIAANSVPRTIDYQGVILDANNNPIVTQLTFRFSFWADSDYNGNSILPSGEINNTLPSFSQYSEIQQITPDRNGNFRTAIGNISPLPKLNPNIHKYLQVEVKTPNTPLSSFELLDTDNDPNNTNDRKPLSSSPYAITAESVEYSDLGYEAGKIPTLDENGKLLKKAIPNGTESNTFILNANDQDEDIRLQFGYTLNKVIKWAKDLARFEIGDSLHIWGDLSTSGKINGRDISADGQKLDEIGNIATATKDAKDISFASDLFRATNVFDALIGLKSLISENTQSILDLRTNIADLSSGFENTKTNIAKLSEQATGFLAQISSLEEISKSLTNEINAVVVRITSLESSSKSFAEQITGLLGRTTSIETTNKSFAEQIASFFSRATSLETTSKSLADQITGIANRASSLENTSKSFADQIASAVARITSLEDATDSLSEQTTETSLQTDENTDNIATLQATINDNQKKSLIGTVYSFDFLSGTDNKGLKSGSDNNRGVIIFHNGSITSMGITSNPIDNSALGTVYITKNDNGSFDQAKVIASTTLSGTGSGDSNNSKLENFTNPINVTQGDVLRAYHLGKDDATSNLFIEVQSNVANTAVVAVTTETQSTDVLTANIKQFNDRDFYNFLVQNNLLKELRKNKKEAPKYLAEKYKEYLEKKKR